MVRILYAHNMVHRQVIMRTWKSVSKASLERPTDPRTKMMQAILSVGRMMSC